jgi:hypothetical protein
VFLFGFKIVFLQLVLCSYGDYGGGYMCRG